MAGEDNECLICCDQIKESHPIWVCEDCLTCIHATCAERWSQNRGEGGEWTCPCCRSSFVIGPEPRCYCGAKQGKEATGHSCWGPCARPRKFGCPHPCASICHPGPCAPCGVDLPALPCACGKKEFTPQCGTPSLTEVQRLCGALCGKELPCLEKCREICHPGPCEACRDVVQARCYCGQTERDILCGESARDEAHGHVGLFSCDTTCRQVLGCGNHYCQSRCHPGDCSVCEVDCSQDRCPCGSMAVKELSTAPRNSCLDPFPVCGQVCQKLMPCGHHCQRQCHVGRCDGCTEPVERICRCGSSKAQSPCSEIPAFAIVSIGGETSAVPELVCEKRCGQLLSCGRHRCKTRCCPYRGSGVDGHDCEYQCNKTLGCKMHKCSSPCHKGRCQPCLEASFDETVCSCGRTTAYPPIPCGAVLPTCPFLCSRPARCGHVIPHSCHFGECSVRASCSTMVKRPCCGGHTTEMLVPCWVAENGSDIVCPSLCQKQLPCGKHSCSRSCHAGPCLGEGLRCAVKCGKKLACGHPCPDMCHDDECGGTCQIKVDVTCECGSLTESRCCGDVDVPCTEVCEVRQWRAAFSPFLLTFAAAFPRLVASIEDRLEVAIEQQRTEAAVDPHHEVRLVLYFANGLYGSIAEHIGLAHDCQVLPPVLLEDGRCKVELFVGAFAHIGLRLSQHLRRQPCLPVGLLAQGDVLLCDKMPVPAGSDVEEKFRPEGDHPQAVLACHTGAGRIVRALQSQVFDRYLLAEVFSGEWAICFEDEKDQAFASMIVSAHHVTLQLCRDTPAQVQSAAKAKPSKDLMSSNLMEVRPAKQHREARRRGGSPPLATANAFALLSELEI